MKNGINPAAVERAKRIDPAAFLQSRGLLTKRTPGAWASIKCPVHKAGNEAHQSMRVHLGDGHYRCMVCGERGGDLIALHRLLTGARFADAVQELARCA